MLVQHHRPSIILLTGFLLVSSLAAAKPTPKPKTVNSAAHLAAPATQSAVTLETALTDLTSGDWILQWGAMDTLASSKAKVGIEPLRKLLADKNQPWLRARALTTLAAIIGDEALTDATPLAGDDDPQIRAAAAASLGLIGSEKGKPLVTKLLTDAVPAVQQEALIALARIDKAAAWDVVAPHLKDPDPLQPAAIRAAAYVGTDQSRAKLTELLAKQTLRVPTIEAIAAVRDAKLIQPLIAQMTLEKDRYKIGEWEKAMAKFDPADLTQPMLGVIAAQNPTLARSAVKLLQGAPTKEVCDQVAAQLAGLTQQDPLALPGAFDLLSRFDADAYSDAILPYLHHTAPEVRRAAIDGISRAHSADHFALYQDLLADADKTVRAAAYQALRRATQALPKGAS